MPAYFSHIIIGYINAQQGHLLANQLHEQSGDTLANAATAQIQLADGHRLQCIENCCCSIALYGIQSQHKLLQGHPDHGAAQYIRTFLGYRKRIEEN